jgi:cellulase
MYLLPIAAAALAFTTTAYAHAQVYGLRVNDQHQGDGRNKYIRSPSSNSPIRWDHVTHPSLICNIRDDNQPPGPAPDFVRAFAGDRVAFQWYHARPNDPTDYVLDSSHLGVLVTWIAPYTDGPGTGPIWTKIQQDGWNGTHWATSRLIGNGGFVEFRLPGSLKPGKYLVRQEIIALHQADMPGPNRGPEFYPSCAQLEVFGSGEAAPPQGYDINKGYAESGDKLWFNIYINKNDEFKMPGPEVWDGGCRFGERWATEEPGKPKVNQHG